MNTHHKPDVTGLVTGLLFVLIAAGALFVTFGGDMSGAWFKAALPVSLIVIGGAGLALSRGREN
ncbi:hypothetical protein GCM10027418_24880 [Mariniluteicoccus endophyticus]